MTIEKKKLAIIKKTVIKKSIWIREENMAKVIDCD